MDSTLKNIYIWNTHGHYVRIKNNLYLKNENPGYVQCI